MKQYHVFLVLAVLMSMVGTKAFAYDIAIENEDGITIYYNYINNSTELEVTSSYSSYYTGDIVIPESVTIFNRTRNVTSIGDYAFYYCGSLSSVTIPASVTSIGEGAFCGCIDLSSVNIPASVTSIGNAAFFYCTDLEKVIVKDFAAWCSISFYDSSSNPLRYAHHLYADENTEITDFAIPEGVTSIGEYAFYECSGLSSVTIPASVTSIGSDAFYKCSGLKKVIVKDLAAWCSISFGNRWANPLRYAHHLYTDENTEITDLVIPEGVTSIGDYAFYECSGLSSVTIPEGVTSIGYYAFYECSGLSSVTIPASMTSIGYCAFNGCSGLGSVTIPEGVTSIDWWAFYRCSGLSSVTIPASVTSIGDYAFDNCENLATIVSFIEEPSSVSFYDSSFSSITLNNATLLVPQGTTEKYKAAEGWKKFVWIEEGVPAGIKLPTSENVESAGVLRYAPDGRRLAEPKRGLNIMKMPDGKTKKVIVR